MTAINILEPSAAPDLDMDIADAVAALRAAADRISAPGAWTTGAAGRTADGTQTGPHNPAAVQFCLTGALECETDPYADRRVYNLAIRALRYAIGGNHMQNDPVRFNDFAPDAATVAAMARRAADRLESRPAYL